MSALDKVAPYYKAVTGFAIPFLGSLGTALLDGSDGGRDITTAEWLAAVTLGLVAGGAVFSIPNNDPQAQHQAESVQPPPRELGALDTGILITIAAVVVIVCGVIFIAQAF
jgi:hypothetical protein